MVGSQSSAAFVSSFWTRRSPSSTYAPVGVIRLHVTATLTPGFPVTVHGKCQDCPRRAQHNCGDQLSPAMTGWWRSCWRLVHLLQEAQLVVYPHFFPASLGCGAIQWHLAQQTKASTSFSVGARDRPLCLHAFSDADSLPGNVCFSFFRVLFFDSNVALFFLYSTIGRRPVMTCRAGCSGGYCLSHVKHGEK